MEEEGEITSAWLHMAGWAVSFGWISIRGMTTQRNRSLGRLGHGTYHSCRKNTVVTIRLVEAFLVVYTNYILSRDEIMSNWPKVIYITRVTCMKER